jgi:hypothetical protein
MKMIRVTWVDAETIGDSGWQDLSDIQHIKEVTPPVMKTIGFVLGDFDTHITITDSIGEKECGHVTKIPKEMIRTACFLGEIVKAKEEIKNPAQREG